MWFFATSARFKAKEGIENAVPLGDGIMAARGIDGIQGSGVYSSDQMNESADAAVEQLLEKYKSEGMMDKLWAIFEEEYERISNLPEN